MSFLPAVMTSGRSGPAGRREGCVGGNRQRGLFLPSRPGASLGVPSPRSRAGETRMCPRPSHSKVSVSRVSEPVSAGRSLGGALGAGLGQPFFWPRARKQTRVLLLLLLRAQLCALWD